MNPIRKWLGKQFYFAVQKWIDVRSGRVVMSGPFKGLKYPPHMIGNALYSKYLGIYEKEIHVFLTRLKEIDFNKIVDVGAAEGYYVIGAALLFPKAKVVAFEAGIDGQHSIQRMSKLNHVESRVDINGFCHISDLNNVLESSEGETLVIMDVEGAEIQLLDPIQVPALSKAFILVETHDFCSPSCASTIYERFSSSHRIQSVSSCSRTSADLPFPCSSSFLSKWLLHVGSDQRCAVQDWLLLIPKSFSFVQM